MIPSQHTRVVADTTQYVSVDAFLRANQGVIGRTLLYEAIRRGEIPHVRIGRRIRVPRNALDLMREVQQREQQAD